MYRKTHEHILIVMPKNSINSLKDNKFNVLPEENFYHELTHETITSIYERIDEYSKEGEKTFLFIDDMTAGEVQSNYGYDEENYL